MGEVALVNPRGDRPEPDEDVAFVGMADLSAESGVAGPGVSRPFHEVSQGYTVFRNEDLLVAKITPCFENGKTGQAKLTRPIGVGSTEFHVVRPNPDQLDSRFALHFLRQGWIRRSGELRMTGSAGQRRVPAAFLAELEVPLPPIEEQRRIAAILDQVSGSENQRTQALSLIKLARGSALERMQEAVQERAELRTLSDLITKGTTPSSLKLPMAPEGIPFLRAQNLVSGVVVHGGPADQYIDASVHSVLKRSVIRSGDVLVSIAGTIGRSALVPDASPDMNCNQAVALVRLKDPKLGRWIQCWLESQDAQRQMGASSVTGTISNLSLAQLGHLRVPVPAVATLDQFNFVYSAFESSLQPFADNLLVLRRLRTVLQARAFSGRL